MKPNHLLATLRPGQRLETKALDPVTDPLLAAVTEHAARFEAAAAASALEVKNLNQTVNDLTLEMAAMKANPSLVGHEGQGMPSPISEFIKSSVQLEAMRGGSTGTGRVELKAAGLKILAKQISNTGLGQAGDAPYNVQPQRDAANLWANPQRPLTLLQLLPSISVSASTFEFMQLSAPAPIAGVQAKEFDTKAEAAIATGVQSASICTIAHWVRCSTQILQDAGALQVQLNNLLEYGCLNKLEAQLVNGPGGVGQIKGLLPSATAFVPTSTAAQDKIGEAVTALASVGFAASVIVLNPVDWFALQRVRGETNDTYLLGSPRDPSPPSLWNVPVVTSASLAVGTALVMDASQVCLLDRQQVSVQLSTENGTDFVQNAVTVRAELRSGLAIFSPSAVLSLSIATA